MNIQKELSNLILDIQKEIESRPQYPNIGKKGCLKRLQELYNKLPQGKPSVMTIDDAVDNFTDRAFNRTLVGANREHINNLKLALLEIIKGVKLKQDFGSSQINIQSEFNQGVEATMKAIEELFNRETK